MPSAQIIRILYIITISLQSVKKKKNNPQKPTKKKPNTSTKQQQHNPAIWET